MASISLLQSNGVVLVIDPRVDVRSAVRDVLRGFGFYDVVLLEGLPQAIPYLDDKKMPPKWIITSISAEKTGTGLDLLVKRLDRQHLAGIHVSLLVADYEMQCIPAAFELGALSWHKKPFTNNELTKDIDALINNLEEGKNAPAVVAATYLRSYLQSANQPKDLIALEQSLVKTFPEYPDAHIKLAEALYADDQLEDARQSLMTARFLGGNVAKCADQLLQLLDGNAPKGPAPTPASFAEVLDYRLAVVVDPDTVAAKDAEKALKELGIQKVEVFADGQTAWEFMEASVSAPDLIIQEWRLPRLSGLALLQRIRQKGWHNTTAVVLSSLPKGDDIAFLREAGVANVISKPIEKPQLISQLLSCLKQERFPADQKSLERRIRQMLAEKRRGEASALKTKLEALPNVPAYLKLCLEAEFHFYDGKFDKARDAAVEALNNKGDSLILLNLLGKTFLKLKDFTNATKCLSRAQQLSGKNLDRLCALAEASLMSGEPDAAKEAVAQAAAIDAGNQAVLESGAKVAISTGDIQGARDLMLQAESLDGLGAYLNNRGVSLVHEQKLDEAIGLYSSALQAIPKQEVKILNTVRYNLGLAYSRVNKLQDAKAVLNDIRGTVDSGLLTKASDLLRRVDAAMASGVALKLATAPVQVADTRPRKTTQRHVALFARPGEIALHRVYQTVEEWPKEVVSLLKTA